VLSSFPSPSSDMIPGIGVKYYGVMIALGVLAGVSARPAPVACSVGTIPTRWPT
jgi:hypothetical protein